MSHLTLGGVGVPAEPLSLGQPARASRIYTLQSGVRRVISAIDLGLAGTNDNLAITQIWTVWVMSAGGRQTHHANGTVAIARAGATVNVDVSNINPANAVKALTAGTLTVVWDATVVGTTVEFGIIATTSLATPQIYLASIGFVPIPLFGTVQPS
jgi:hypothetical protein